MESVPNSIFFSAEERGFESKSVTDTRATTDNNDPSLIMVFKHGKKWVDKNGATCNMGFGCITKNTRVGGGSFTVAAPQRFLHCPSSSTS